MIEFDPSGKSSLSEQTQLGDDQLIELCVSSVFRDRRDSGVIGLLWALDAS